MLTNFLYCLADPTSALEQLESCQLLDLVSTTVLRENVTFPSHVNSMSHVNTTRGNATSHLMEI